MGLLVGGRAAALQPGVDQSLPLLAEVVGLGHVQRGRGRHVARGRVGRRAVLAEAHDRGMAERQGRLAGVNVDELDAQRVGRSQRALEAAVLLVRGRVEGGRARQLVVLRLAHADDLPLGIIAGGRCEDGPEWLVSLGRLQLVDGGRPQDDVLDVHGRQCRLAGGAQLREERRRGPGGRAGEGLELLDLEALTLLLFGLLEALARRGEGSSEGGALPRHCERKKKRPAKSCAVWPVRGFRWDRGGRRPCA